MVVEGTILGSTDYEYKDSTEHILIRNRYVSITELASGLVVGESI